MNKILLTTLISFYFLTAFSQNINEQKSTMSLGPNNCYYMEIEEGTKDLIEDAWKEYIKTYGKTENNKKAREFYTINAKVPMINGTKTTNIYMKIEEGKSMVTTYFWADLGGTFANSNDHKAESEGIYTFLSDFYVMARKKVVSKELEKEEKLLKDKEKDLGKLEQKNKDYHEDIEKAKQKIVQAENNIVQNIKDQDSKKGEISMQQKVVQAVIEKLNAIGKNKN